MASDKGDTVDNGSNLSSTGVCGAASLQMFCVLRRVVQSVQVARCRYMVDSRGAVRK